MVSWRMLEDGLKACVERMRERECVGCVVSQGVLKAHCTWCTMWESGAL